jgi:hypothetical protein
VGREYPLLFRIKVNSTFALQLPCSAAEKCYMIAEVDYPVQEAERPLPVFADGGTEV